MLLRAATPAALLARLRRGLPFGRLLARLSVSRKLMLIYLLDLSAVIYVSGILINEKFIAIDFARKEVQGNAYVAVSYTHLTLPTNREV